LAWGKGDQAAFEQLAPIVYDELQRIAGRLMAREHAPRTLQTTALVNEAYLRLVDIKRVHWQNRAHFFAMSARFMRRILVDAARSRNNLKRGSGAQKVSIDDAVIAWEPDREVIALDDALSELAKTDERKSKVVEMRFFAGLSVEETAEALGVSVETVMRDWKSAKQWLARQLSRS
jgi:RNA polymerase sigma factor (TIGR02999 family)